jgi:hypothetical protein
MKHIFSRGSDSCSTGKENIWNPTVQQIVRKRSLYPIPSQMNPFRTLTTRFLNIHRIIVPFICVLHNTDFSPLS